MDRDKPLADSLENDDGVARPPDTIAIADTRRAFGEAIAMTGLLEAMENRFFNTPGHYNTVDFRKRREGTTFDEVRACLEGDPALARTVWAMQKRGGEPDFFGRVEGFFLFLEAAKNPCLASRNCVYDKASADRLKTYCPRKRFNGSVEEQCAEMGARVMTEKLRRTIQTLGTFTVESWEWLDSSRRIASRATPDVTAINHGKIILDAQDAFCHGNHLFVREVSARLPYSYRGWRAVAWGSER